MDGWMDGCLAMHMRPSPRWTKPPSAGVDSDVPILNGTSTTTNNPKPGTSSMRPRPPPKPARAGQGRPDQPAMAGQAKTGASSSSSSSKTQKRWCACGRPDARPDCRSMSTCAKAHSPTRVHRVGAICHGVAWHGRTDGWTRPSPGGGPGLSSPCLLGACLPASLCLSVCLRLPEFVMTPSIAIFPFRCLAEDRGADAKRSEPVHPFPPIQLLTPSKEQTALSWHSQPSPTSS